MTLRNALLPIALLVAAASSSPAAPAARSFEATYVAIVEDIPAGLNRLEVWVPLPQDAASQRIRNLKVESPYVAVTIFDSEVQVIPASTPL